MPKSVLSLILALTLLSAASSSAAARAPLAGSGSHTPEVPVVTRPWTWRVRAVKMLAPGVGWATSDGRLLLTENGGKDWRDITPPANKRSDGVGRGGIFFLDRSTGWITSGHYEPNSDKLQVDLSSTIDGGENWSQKKSTFRLKDFGLATDYAAGGGVQAIAFADHLHAWMNVAFGGQSMNSMWTFLLTSADGGRTWERAADPPLFAGPEMLLITPANGWLYSDNTSGDGPGLYFTRDGARSWHEFVAPNPTDLEQCEARDLPRFKDAEHGFLPETCVPTKPYEVRRTQVLMATSDGGRTWKPDRMVFNVTPDFQKSPYRSSIVVGSEWIFVTVSDHRPLITRIGAGARIDASAGTALPFKHYGEIRNFSFATPSEGWVVIGDGELLSTTDGGATWTDITPGFVPIL